MLFPTWISSPACVCVAAFLSAGAAASRLSAQSDDFNDGNDAGWLHYNPLAPFGAVGTYSFPNGGYRINAPASPAPEILGPQRIGSLQAGSVYTRIQSSVDIEGWDNTINQSLGLIARVRNLGLGTTSGYTYNYNTGSGFHQLNLVVNEAPSRQINESLFKIDPTQKYRLTFTLAGPHILGQMFSATNSSVPLHSVFAVDDTHDSGTAGVFAFAIAPTGAVDARFDNYSAGVPGKLRASFLDATPAAGQKTAQPIDYLSARLASLETKVKPESIRLEVNGVSAPFEIFDGAPLYVLSHVPSPALNPDLPHTARITFSDEDGIQTVAWTFGAPSPAPTVRLMGAPTPTGVFSVESLASLDSVVRQFSVPRSGETRFYQIADSTARRITSIQVVSGSVLISFQ